jgi:hypothetical protein
MPYYPGADRILFTRYAAASGNEIGLTIAVYGSPRAEDRSVRIGDWVTDAESVVKLETLESCLVGGARYSVRMPVSAKHCARRYPKIASARFAGALKPVDRLAHRRADMTR